MPLQVSLIYVIATPYFKKKLNGTYILYMLSTNILHIFRVWDWWSYLHCSGCLQLWGSTSRDRYWKETINVYGRHEHCSFCAKALP